MSIILNGKQPGKRNNPNQLGRDNRLGNPNQSNQQSKPRRNNTQLMRPGIITHGDLMNPWLRELPPQWSGIPPELFEKLVPRRGFLLREEWLALQKIMSSEYLLLKNYWNFRCGKCNQIHEYYTTGCIERPFNRLTAIQGLIKEKEAEKNGDLILNGISLGTIVPITKDEATKLLWKIKLKRYVVKV